MLNRAHFSELLFLNLHKRSFSFLFIRAVVNIPTQTLIISPSLLFRKMIISQLELGRLCVNQFETTHGGRVDMFVIWMLYTITSWSGLKRCVLQLRVKKGFLRIVPIKLCWCGLKTLIMAIFIPVCFTYWGLIIMNYYYHNYIIIIITVKFKCAISLSN